MPVPCKKYIYICLWPWCFRWYVLTIAGPSGMWWRHHRIGTLSTVRGRDQGRNSGTGRGATSRCRRRAPGSGPAACGPSKLRRSPTQPQPGAPRPGTTIGRWIDHLRKASTRRTMAPAWTEGQSRHRPNCGALVFPLDVFLSKSTCDLDAFR